MSQSVWRIAADTPDYTADDLTGEGAKRTGGRWNRPGLPVLYTSQTRALACLETFVHLKAASLPLNRYLVRLDIPDDVWRGAKQLALEDLPVGWDAEPAGKISLDLGSDWISGGASCLLIVPSVIVPEEQNVLISPQHKDHVRVTATKIRRWLYDPRLGS
ncbi:MAG: RES family NAD+ phosphorylase [Sphingomicrobium sp.]